MEPMSDGETAGVSIVATSEVSAAARKTWVPEAVRSAITEDADRAYFVRNGRIHLQWSRGFAEVPPGTPSGAYSRPSNQLSLPAAILRGEWGVADEGVTLAWLSDGSTLMLQPLGEVPIR